MTEVEIKVTFDYPCNLYCSDDGYDGGGFCFNHFRGVESFQLCDTKSSMVSDYSSSHLLWEGTFSTLLLEDRTDFWFLTTFEAGDGHCCLAECCALVPIPTGGVPPPYPPADDEDDGDGDDADDAGGHGGGTPPAGGHGGHGGGTPPAGGHGGGTPPIGESLCRWRRSVAKSICEVGVLIPAIVDIVALYLDCDACIQENYLRTFYGHVAKHLESKNCPFYGLVYSCRLARSNSTLTITQPEFVRNVYCFNSGVNNIFGSEVSLLADPRTNPEIDFYGVPWCEESQQSWLQRCKRGETEKEHQHQVALQAIMLEAKLEAQLERRSRIARLKLEVSSLFSGEQAARILAIIDEDLGTREPTVTLPSLGNLRFPYPP